MAIGSDIVAKAMKHEGVKDFFYIMGGPMLAVEPIPDTFGTVANVTADVAATAVVAHGVGAVASAAAPGPGAAGLALALVPAAVGTVVDRAELP